LRGLGGLTLSLGTPQDGFDMRHQLTPIERLCQIIIGAEAEALDLAVEVRVAGQDQDRGIGAGAPQLANDLVAVDVRQHQVDNSEVVIIQPADFQALLPQAGDIAAVSLGFQDSLDAACDRRIVVDQQDTHSGRAHEKPARVGREAPNLTGEGEQPVTPGDRPIPFIRMPIG